MSEKNIPFCTSSHVREDQNFLLLKRDEKRKMLLEALDSSPIVILTAS